MNSKYSRPRREHSDGSYEIHIVKADEPNYIPGDIELWPVFHAEMAATLRRNRDLTRTF
jgi:hypothetical protein